jgi:hypothetical protein
MRTLLLVWSIGFVCAHDASGQSCPGDINQDAEVNVTGVR